MEVRLPLLRERKEISSCGPFSEINERSEGVLVSSEVHRPDEYSWPGNVRELEHVLSALHHVQPTHDHGRSSSAELTDFPEVEFLPPEKVTGGGGPRPAEDGGNKAKARDFGSVGRLFTGR
jgi:transcriptional regulator with GAF, ATPase, and Fis domain